MSRGCAVFGCLQCLTVALVSPFFIYEKARLEWGGVGCAVAPSRALLELCQSELVCQNNSTCDSDNEHFSKVHVHVGMYLRRICDASRRKIQHTRRRNESASVNPSQLSDILLVHCSAPTKHAASSPSILFLIKPAPSMLSGLARGGVPLVCRVIMSRCDRNISNSDLE